MKLSLKNEFLLFETLSSFFSFSQLVKWANFPRVEFLNELFKVLVNENFSTLLDFVFVFVFIFGMSGS